MVPPSHSSSSAFEQPPSTEVVSWPVRFSPPSDPSSPSSMAPEALPAEQGESILPQLASVTLTKGPYPKPPSHSIPARRNPWGPTSSEAESNPMADAMRELACHPFGLTTISRSEPLPNHGRITKSSSGEALACGAPGEPVAGRCATVLRQSEDHRMLQRGEQISLGLSTTARDAAACADGRLSFDTRDEDPEVLRLLLRNMALGRSSQPVEAAEAREAAAAVRRSLGGPRAAAFVPQYCGIPERETGSSLDDEPEAAAVLALEAQSLIGGRRGRALPHTAAAASGGGSRPKRSFEEPAEAAAPPPQPPQPPVAQPVQAPAVPATAAEALKAAPAAVLESTLFAQSAVEPRAVAPPAPQPPRDQRSSGSDDDTTMAFSLWQASHPCILSSFDNFLEQAAGKRVVVFLDYDGTLTPIVSNPDHAFMSPAMRTIVKEVGRTFPTAIISGRGRLKVEDFVQLDELFYAGSHGLDIKGPVIQSVTGEEREVLPLTLEGGLLAMMAEVKAEAEASIACIAGATVEDNKYSVSVHFRNCHLDDWSKVFSATEAIVASRSSVHMTRGRKVLEIRPRVNWDKGKALLHLLRALGLADSPDVMPLYIGDDRTDEDAFRVLCGSGVGVLVSSISKATAASFTLSSPDQVAVFLSRLVDWGQHSTHNAWRQSPACVGWVATPPAADLAGEGSCADRVAALREIGGVGAAGGIPHVESLSSVTTAGWPRGAAGPAHAAAAAAAAAQRAGGRSGSGSGGSHGSGSAVSSDFSADMETVHGGKGAWASPVSGERV
eukprot:jgi/Ulvmu1/5490/UM023_0026.1